MELRIAGALAPITQVTRYQDAKSTRGNRLGRSQMSMATQYTYGDGKTDITKPLPSAGVAQPTAPSPATPTTPAAPAATQAAAVSSASSDGNKATDKFNVRKALDKAGKKINKRELQGIIKMGAESKKLRRLVKSGGYDLGAGAQGLLNKTLRSSGLAPLRAGSPKKSGGASGGYASSGGSTKNPKQVAKTVAAERTKNPNKPQPKVTKTPEFTYNKVSATDQGIGLVLNNRAKAEALKKYNDKYGVDRKTPNIKENKSDNKKQAAKKAATKVASSKKKK